MSRAAESPLPPPPPGSVWERIEQAREEEGISYYRLSLLAHEGNEALGGSYRTIATRNGWKAGGDVRDRFVAALARLGFSELWLALGRGPRRGDEPVPVVDTLTMAQKAALELVKHNDMDLPTAWLLFQDAPAFYKQQPWTVTSLYLWAKRKKQLEADVTRVRWDKNGTEIETEPGKHNVTRRRKKA